MAHNKIRHHITLETYKHELDDKVICKSMTWIRWIDRLHERHNITDKRSIVANRKAIYEAIRYYQGVHEGKYSARDGQKMVKLSKRIIQATHLITDMCLDATIHNADIGIGDATIKPMVYDTKGIYGFMLYGNPFMFFADGSEAIHKITSSRWKQ